MRASYWTVPLTVVCAIFCVHGQRDRTPATDLTIDQIISRTMGNNQMSCENSHNSDSQCEDWARQGECDINPDWMPVNCQKACGTCSGTATTRRPRVTTRRPPVTTQRPGATTLRPRATTRVSCENSHNSDSQCEDWARQGECDINPDWMPVNCQKACGTCSATASTRRPPVTTQRPRATTLRPRATTRVSCENSHNSDSQCEDWARQGECEINPDWMPVNCQKACGTCSTTATTRRPRVTIRRPPVTTQRPRATTLRPRVTTHA